MYAEELPVFLWNKGMAAMRAHQSDRCCNEVTGSKCLSTDFALILTIPAIIVVDEVVRSTAYGADNIFGNGFTIPALDRSERLLVFPLVVFQKKLPVLFDKGFDDW